MTQTASNYGTVLFELGVKKEIVEKAFFGPITPEIPASILQLHPEITVIYAKE